MSPASDPRNDGERARAKVIECARQCEALLTIADECERACDPRAAEWRDYAAMWSTEAFLHVARAAQP